MIKSVEHLKSKQPVVTIVDDENIVTQSIQSFLELETDFIVYTFQCPIEDLAQIKQFTPDIVISDFLMPKMNGLEFLAEVKKLYPDVPRILLTAYADKENTIKGVNEVSLFQYLEKPWDNDQLLLVIKNGIANKSLRESLKEKIREIDEILRHRDELFDLNNIFQQELSFAKRMQNKFLPADEININGVKVLAKYKPALEIGGDFFDVIPLGKNKTAIVLADLTGHGIQAALCTALIKFAFSSFKDSNTSAEDIIVGMNDVLYKGLPNDIFAATLVAVFNTKKRECELVNGGIPHPIILRRNKKAIEKVFADGLILGMVKNEVFQPGDKQTIILDGGDSLIFFTDGVTEIKNVNNKILGEEFLIDIVSQNLQFPITKIIETVMEKIQKLKTGKNKLDDITILNVAIDSVD